MAKQRQVRMEQKSPIAQMQALESKTDDELLREQKYRSAALAILGARAAERYDPVAAREYFRKAVAAARPQERMQLRRMADASIAMAERRPDDLKAAMEKLGQQAPSSRQLFLLRIAGLLAPPPGAPRSARIRGIFLLILLVVVLLTIGFLLAKLVGLAFGGISTAGAFFLGLVIIALILGGLTFFGRKRQKKALAARAAGNG
ncbi:hypothetical protein GKE82_02550 [Conexibacter sp. W3-3-2]|uniref:Uncharacterized protein n=1 Tax=Paraconexibacter algicola TaxID=2133960 RepID=A0A2T4UCQ4_9ACTN|nr:MULTISPECIES: hypothetical protein [Solirubrobacterales]MTD43213.1 hypothetical protein [Conexibacter sp. W3-3-2]PTL54961.1 hypothetical protein C7Y72_20540 [Paraconexibacter algicola]